MMHKNDFKKLISKIRGSDQGLRVPKLMNPVRDWWIGLLISLLIFTIASVWSSYTYTRHRDMVVEEVALVDSSTVVYREAMVKSALEYFAAKQEQHEALIRAAQSLDVEASLLDVDSSVTDDTQSASSSVVEIEVPMNQDSEAGDEPVSLGN
ncbi:hypothetical protein KC902_03385 [Candidatus Kaiserbacteria bacterium]|nr:hypothetical protein [Candidatus Kaiserbacteria bacterium]